MATLAQAVQGLPAELYNNILDFVLTHDEDVVTIDQHYKPPAEMRISHATRVYFATSYYTKTIFHVKGVDALDTWLNSISDNDAKNIRTIHFEAEAEVKRLQASMVSIGLQPASEDFATAMYLRLLLDRDLRNKIASFKAVMHCKVEGRKGEEWHRAGQIFDRNGFVTSVS